MIKTYLGKKGYSIYKQTITDIEKQNICNESTPRGFSSTHGLSWRHCLRYIQANIYKHW